MSEQTLIASMNQAVQAQAAIDPTFRANLLANPRAAVESFFGADLPAHITLKVVEEAPDTYIIPVPYMAPLGTDGELSDDDLEAVAGGSKSGVTNFVNSATNSVENFGTRVGNKLEKTGSRIAASTVKIATGDRPHNLC